jgi:multimeric flavodoxin WrbA
MYKTKPAKDCEQPFPQTDLKVLMLNASLKHKSSEVPSNTEEVCELVLKEMMNEEQKMHGEIIRLSDKNIPAGLTFRESPDDEWPEIAQKIRETDILVLATPIWWGGRSSLIQRVIERLDAFDEEYHTGHRSALYNKVAGVIITGSEDGALNVMGSIMMVLSWMGFTLPPECCTYWVGEVGQPVATDRERRLKNVAVEAMAKNMARNLAYYAALLKNYPLVLV